MEYNEKRFQKLNNKFVELQSEFIELANEKSKMENKFMREIQEANEKIFTLEEDNKELSLLVTKKNAIIQKLQKENGKLDIVIKQYQSKEKTKNALEQEKEKLELIVKKQKEEKKQYKAEIELLLSQNKLLEKEIKSRETNKEEEGAIEYYEQQLDESNNTIKRMSDMIKELEGQIEDLQNEIERQTSKNINEDDIKNYISQINLLSEEKKKLYEDNTKMFNEIDKLQNQIELLKRGDISSKYTKLNNTLILEDNKSNDELSD